MIKKEIAIEIDTIIETTMTLDEFHDKFIEFAELNGSYCYGQFKEIEDEELQEEEVLEKILCSAVYFDDGVTYRYEQNYLETGFVICGRRHSDCFRTLYNLGKSHTDYKLTEGFVTDVNRFVDRVEARKVAIKSRQVKDVNVAYELYSKDLY